jgi:hypothetical protein
MSLQHRVLSPKAQARYMAGRSGLLLHVRVTTLVAFFEQLMSTTAKLHNCSRNET